MKKLNKIKEHIKELCSENDEFLLLKNYIQHGNTNVYTHSIYVAHLSLSIARKLNLKIEERSLIRGALLHDFFLYDWHDKNHPKLHGFKHPYIALENAKERYDLSTKEEDIIKKHMFPLTLIPPRYKESYIICLADKICSLLETFHKIKIGGIVSE